MSEQRRKKGTPRRRGGSRSRTDTLEHARRHLDRLYEIGKLLAHFEGVRRTLPLVLALATDALRIRVAVLVDGGDKERGRPRTLVWHASSVDPAKVAESKKLARASYAYFVSSAPGNDWVGTSGPSDDDLHVTLQNLHDAGDTPSKRISLPLAVDHLPVFGVLWFECHQSIDNVDLAFLSAVANQIAVALDRHHARRLEMTLRERAESSLLREQTALRTAREAVEARDALISAASHELRNPLNMVLLEVSMLAKTLGSTADERVTARLERSKRQIERMTRLINNLLDVSRVRAGRLDLELEDVDLLTVVREVVSRSREEAKHSGCEIVLRGDLPITGWWDRMRLDQIVTNLLSNALKYGRGKPIVIALESDDVTARLSVQDFGIGIQPEDQSRIFNRFERARGEQRFVGFGLGLWIVRQIVEAMGGTIRVASELGKGSTFTVDLPRKKGSRQRGAA